MFKKALKIGIHISAIILLTVLTQIGGLIYLLTMLFIRRKVFKYRMKRGVVFVLLYGLATAFIVPSLASHFGRERVAASQLITAHSVFYTLANRNYVTPALNIALEKSAVDFQRKYPGIKLVYLDANFPFIDGFPLLPHLSHSDGKKIDISFVYEDDLGNTNNLKPGISGYGIYAGPKISEVNQPAACKNKGYWHYGFTQYLTLGTIHENLSISEEGTRALSLSLLKQKSVSKLFIEPHLNKRLRLLNNKVRFHGCQAVRHDDHIHVQVK